MSRLGFVLAAAVIVTIAVVTIAVASGNGGAMMKALETGLARGVGYQIAHELIGGRR